MSQQWEPPGQQPWEQPDPRPAPQPEPLDAGRQPPPVPTAELPPHAALPGTRPYDPGQFAPPQAFGYQPYPQYAGGPQLPPVPQGPPVRSRSALAAVLIQFVQCAGWAIVALYVMTSPPSRFADPEDLQQNLDDVRAGLVVGGTLILAVAAGMVTLAILTLRRVNGCRIASAVVQIVFGSFALLGLLANGSSASGGPLTLQLLDVVASATGATLLFLGSSAAYCRRLSPYPGGVRPY